MAAMLAGCPQAGTLDDIRALKPENGPQRPAMDAQTAGEQLPLRIRHLAPVYAE